MKRAIVGLVLGLLFLSGCSSKVVTPKVAIKDPNAAWARVLRTYVNNRGLVDFAKLDKNRGDLEQYVAYIAQTSPKSHPKKFPTADSRMAYYINSYNALSMYNVLLKKIPKDNGTLSKRVRFFFETKFEVGGEYTSLYSYENDVIRKLGDPRIHVALNCMAMACPRLPQTPFHPKRVQAQLEAQAKEFYNETRNVRVDDKEKTVYLSEILDFFTEDFLDKAPSLQKYVNRYRKKKVPLDYEVAFIPYDWTINNQAAVTASKKRTVSGKGKKR